MIQRLRQPNLELLRDLRGWTITLGLVALATSLQLAGIVNLANPKTWTSAFYLFSYADMMSSIAGPVAIAGVALVVAALGLHFVIRRSGR
jgi:hypothetical protein